MGIEIAYVDAIEERKKKAWQNADSYVDATMLSDEDRNILKRVAAYDEKHNNAYGKSLEDIEAELKELASHKINRSARSKQKVQRVIEGKPFDRKTKPADTRPIAEQPKTRLSKAEHQSRLKSITAERKLKSSFGKVVMRYYRGFKKAALGGAANRRAKESLRSKFKRFENRIVKGGIAFGSETFIDQITKEFPDLVWELAPPGAKLDALDQKNESVENVADQLEETAEEVGFSIETKGPAELKEESQKAASSPAVQPAKQPVIDPKADAKGEKDKKAEEAGENPEEAKKEEPQKAKVEAAAGEKEAGKAQGKSAADFQESGKKADKEQAIPVVSSVDKDKTYQQVIKQTEAEEKAQKAHQSVASKSAETKAAGQMPVDQQTSKNDQLAHIAGMNEVAETEEKREPITAESFMAQFGKELDQLEENMPDSEESAEQFKKDKPIRKVKATISNEVKQANENVSGPLKSQVNEKPKSQAETSTPQVIPEAPIGAIPKPIDGTAAAPKPKSDSELSMKNESKSLDDYMSGNDVSEKQLAQSNEPAFVEALGSKKEAQKAADGAPANYRKKEDVKLAGAKEEATQSGQKGLHEMHSARKGVFQQVLTDQKSTGDKDKDQQREIFAKLEGIYAETKDKVTQKLDGMSEKVETAFSTRAEEAQKTFEENVEEKIGEIYGWFSWDDKLLNIDHTEELDKVFQTEKSRFVNTMNSVLNEVATYIANELNAALQLIKEGKKQADDYFNGLSNEQKKLGDAAYNSFNDQYETLEETVYSKQTELASSLASSYKENVDSLQGTFDEIKEKVSAGWLGAAFNFMKGVIETILKIKDLLFNLLAAAVDAINSILDDPIGFLTNLINGIKLGFNNFVGNITKHITSGLIQWLTGSLGSVGITIPDDIFSVKGIFSLSTQVLGLTWDYFRMKAVNMMGESTVNAMEKGFELFQLVREKGFMGLWEELKEQFGDLKETVMGAIQDMVISEVMKAGIKWILSLMNPAGAFIKAAMMIVKIVQFFVERAAQIVELVTAFIDAIRALANGSLSAVAKAIETALVKAVPVLIGFLAALIGLSGLTAKVQKIIKRIRKRIDGAINKVLRKAKAKFGGKKGKKPKPEDEKGKKGKLKPETFKMAGKKHTLTYESGTIMMASVKGSLAIKLKSAKDEVEENLEAPNLQGKGDIVKSQIERLIKVAKGADKKMDAAIKSKDDSKIASAQKTFDKLAGLIGKFGSDYKLKDLDGIVSGGEEVAAEGENQKKLGLLKSSSISKRNGTLEGSGTTLGGNLGSLPSVGTRSDYQAHHIIATSSAKKSVFAKAAAETGYDINRASNGVWLPDNVELAEQVNLPLHKGRHLGKYFRTVASLLNQQETTAKGANKRGESWTEEKLLSRISLLENQLKGRLLDMSDPLKLQNADTLKPEDPNPEKRTF